MCVFSLMTMFVVFVVIFLFVVVLFPSLERRTDENTKTEQQKRLRIEMKYLSPFFDSSSLFFFCHGILLMKQHQPPPAEDDVHTLLVTMPNPTSKTTATNSKASDHNDPAPAVTRDPRFLAGRKLVERGLSNEGAVEMFATLLEECTQKHGTSSIESAPAYYEYGNALLRAALKRQEQQQNDDDDDGDDDKDKSGSSSQDAAVAARRSAAAMAAEKRNQSSTATINNTNKEDEEVDDEEEEEEGDKKPAAKQTGNVGDSNDEMGGDGNDNHDDEDNNHDDDIDLALEMMEDAFSILEDYKDKHCNELSNSSSSLSSSSQPNYLSWVQEQIPRVLLGIGDTLSTLQRHADAADAYSRALELRQSIFQTFSQEQLQSQPTLEHLGAHRKVSEAAILIAEELLACPADEDVVTTETNSLIVKADDRVSYARGYYDKARDALQEAVFCMGTLAARSVDLGREKEDICFLATMVMAVGETLAAIMEEQEQQQNAAKTAEPVKKKAKR
jgi:tetratricopeptide (TPR) repeat protein